VSRGLVGPLHVSQSKPPKPKQTFGSDNAALVGAISKSGLGHGTAECADKWNPRIQGIPLHWIHGK